jgi:uncharacterized protein YdaU (DUF1376 family)
VKGMPWMKLFTEDLDRDCSALSLRAFGAWMRIIIDLKSHDGSRSLSLDGWASVVRSNREETVAALSELIDDQLCDSSVTSNALSQIYNASSNALITLVSRRITREAKAAIANKIRQERLREKRKSNAESNASRNALVTGIEAEAEADIEAEAGVGVCSSSGRRVAKSVQKVSAKSIPTPTPVSAFFLTEELRSWAEAAAPDIDPEAETEKFQDYYGRNGKTFADLPAAWRKWIRDAVERQNRARAPTDRRESRGERNERIIREVEAEDAARAISTHGASS